tara:strand:+ start:1481 stop:3676 length:2196 start_codon:yes stop_codon:yes gene_type:complete
MANYNFRILIKTKEGKKFSYTSSSFFDSQHDTQLTASAWDVFSRISESISCSYVDQEIPASALELTDRADGLIFASNPFVSASLSGSTETGHIEFIYKGTQTRAQNHTIDRIEGFKFYGMKVCNVLGLKHNDWIYPQQVRVSSSVLSTRAGSIDAKHVNVTHNLKMSPYSSISSDLPFKLNHDSSRFIRFMNVSGSDELPHDDLIFGYNDVTNTYVLSASARPDTTTKFVIDGVTSLNVTSITSSYTTSSVKQIFTEITSSGNSVFGDADTDHHNFKGSITSSQGIVVGGSISSSDDIYISNASPNLKLKKSDVGGASVKFYNDGWGDGQADAYITLNSDENFMTATDNDGGDMIFRTSNYANAIYIDDSTQTIGIGTSTPQKTLTVVGDISASSNLYTNGDMHIRKADGGAGQIHWYTDGWAAGDVDAELLLGTDEVLQLRTKNDGGDVVISSTNYSNAVHIDDSTERVGIGTPTPQSTLTVEGDISGSGDLFVGEIGGAYVSASAGNLEISGSGTSQLIFSGSNESLMTVYSEQSGSIFEVKATKDSGSLLLSGSLVLKPNLLKPEVSASKLFNRQHPNGANDIDDLYFGHAGLTPAFAWVTLDDDGTSTSDEVGFGEGSAITSEAYNMNVSHSTATVGTSICPQLDGTYKVTGNYTSIGSTADVTYDIKVGGTTKHTMIAKTHASVDPVERTHIYVGSVSSGSCVTATADGTSFNFEAGSVLLVERLR